MLIIANRLRPTKIFFLVDSERIFCHIFDEWGIFRGGFLRRLSFFESSIFIMSYEEYTKVSTIHLINVTMEGL